MACTRSLTPAATMATSRTSVAGGATPYFQRNRKPPIRVSSIPWVTKKITEPSPMPPRTQAIRSTDRPVSTVSPMR